MKRLHIAVMHDGKEFHFPVGSIAQGYSLFKKYPRFYFYNQEVKGKYLYENHINEKIKRLVSGLRRSVRRWSEVGSGYVPHRGTRLGEASC